MMVKARLAPMSSLLLVGNPDNDEIPLNPWAGNLLLQRILALRGRNAIRVRRRCQPLSLTDEKNNAGPGLRKMFNGRSGDAMTMEVHLYTILLESVVKLPVLSAQTHIEIWTNHETEPGRIVVLVST